MNTPASTDEAHRYAGYTPLCLTGLQKALDPTTNLYRRQLRDAEWQGTRGTEELTSTCICLIGISRSRVDSRQLALDPGRTLEAAIRCAARHRYEGALGLLVWANAVTGGGGLDSLIAATGLPLGDGGAYVTCLTSMETAWLLSGLLHEQVRNPRSRTRQLAEMVMRELEDRYSQSGGLMPHVTEKAALKHRVRHHIANFADQIYSVQAMAFASLVLGASPALDMARKLATRLVALQGPLGQWWWHYDARTGRVVEPFPVYSVHQHAMAPMALMALEAAGGGRFSEAIAASHSWLTRNELGINLIDTAADAIWRDLERRDGPVMRKLRQLRTLLGFPSSADREQRPELRLNRETRPYEWAWCLYAGAIANGVDRGSHIV